MFYCVVRSFVTVQPEKKPLGLTLYLDLQNLLKPKLSQSSFSQAQIARQLIAVDSPGNANLLFFFVILIHFFSFWIELI
jgi:hypothetical protein